VLSAFTAEELLFVTYNEQEVENVVVSGENGGGKGEIGGGEGECILWFARGFDSSKLEFPLFNLPSV